MLAKDSRLKRGGVIVRPPRPTTVTGLVQARRLYYIVALYRRSIEFSSLSIVLLYQEPDTYCILLLLLRCYIPLGP